MDSPRRHEVLPGVSLLTVITDMEHSDAHRWIDPFDASAAKHTIVAGGQRLQLQATELGYTGHHVLPCSGMVVHPAYYQTRHGSIGGGSVGGGSGSSVRARLDASLPTAVVFFGGFGPPLMEAIADQLLHQFRLNLVLLVGKNSALEARLKAKVASGDPVWSRCPVLVDGFIPPATLIEYIETASCVVGKPGPGAVSEAAVLGVPFVTEHNERTMEQEACVVDFIKSEGIGVVVSSLTKPFPPDLFERLEQCRQALASLHNTAVFDVSAVCQKAVRQARTGLAVEREAGTSATEVESRVMRRPSLPWSSIVTHLGDVNEDVVSGRYNSFSGRHSFATDFEPTSSAMRLHRLRCRPHPERGCSSPSPPRKRPLSPPSQHCTRPVSRPHHARTTPALQWLLSRFACVLCVL